MTATTKPTLKISRHTHQPIIVTRCLVLFFQAPIYAFAGKSGGGSGRSGVGSGGRYSGSVKFSTGAIVGITLGWVFVVVIVAYCVWRYRKRDEDEDVMTAAREKDEEDEQGLDGPFDQTLLKEYRVAVS